MALHPEVAVVTQVEVQEVSVVLQEDMEVPQEVLEVSVVLQDMEVPQGVLVVILAEVLQEDMVELAVEQEVTEVLEAMVGTRMTNR